MFKSDSRGVISVLERRYAPFLVKRPRGLGLAVSEAPRRAFPFRPEQVFERGRLVISRGDFRAEITPEADRGTLAAAANEQCLDAFLRSLVSSLLIRSGGLMLHSAGLLKGGRAWLFPGVSGAGKSTLAKLAQGAGAEVISDEINLLRFRAGRPLVYGSPFWGEMRAGGRQGSWPLGGIFLPKKAVFSKAEACSGAEGVRTVMRCLVNFSREAQTGAAALDNAARLLAAAPCARLAFSKKNADFLKLIGPGI